MMGGMKPQYTTATLLLTTTALAIALAGMLGWGQLAGWFNHSSEWSLFRVLSIVLSVGPLWVPIGFAGFVIGRRQITILSVIVLAILEVAALGIVHWQIKHPTLW